MDILYIVVPCYNEEECLPRTAPLFLAKLKSLTEKGLCDEQSRILLVNDGSGDATWTLMQQLHAQDGHFIALDLEPNGGHQKAVMAGLRDAMTRADVTISIDADLQDDINAMDEMLEAYHKGAALVCGVRRSRSTDKFLKRFTARAYYWLMNVCGAKLIFDHADYRLMSREAVEKLMHFHTEHLFLRGMITRLGLPWEKVYYDRAERMAGESKYTLKKMLGLARDGFRCGKMKPEAELRPEDPRIAARLYGE